jgi:hypothetical protein
MAQPTFTFPWDAAMVRSSFLGATQAKGVTGSSREYAKASVSKRYLSMIAEGVADTHTSQQATENAKSSDMSEASSGDKKDVVWPQDCFSVKVLC